MDPRETLTILLYQPRTYRGHLIRALTGSSLTHAIPVLRGLGYHTCLGSKTGWYWLEDLPKEYLRITLRVHLDLELVDSVLPKGRRFPVLGGLRHHLFGGVPPLTCVGACLRVLWLAGIPIKESTPDGLYKALQALHQP